MKKTITTLITIALLATGLLGKPELALASFPFCDSHDHPHSGGLEESP